MSLFDKERMVKLVSNLKRRIGGLDALAKRDIDQFLNDPEKSGSNNNHNIHSQETGTDYHIRMKWWHEARFGMFIHWGLYAVPAGVYRGRRIDGSNEQKLSSYIMKTAKIPIPEYERFAKRFDASEFKANTWVELAKEAGIKYIVVTAKHHEGFCLWDTKTTDFNVVSATPFKRDVLKDLAKACSDNNIKLCLYYSIMDWHYSGCSGKGFIRYRDYYMKEQIKELLTNYGPIGVLWFDGEWIQEWTESQGKQLFTYVRALQPKIIVNNRIGKGRMGMAGMNKGKEYCGDFGTPEQEVPKERPTGFLWESCMTMNDTWGYKSYDFNWKSSKTLIHHLIDTVSKGGNFLLNVGPKANGLIPQASVECLKEIGAWMKLNSEAIYCASEYPIDQPQWGRFTKQNGKLYAHIFDWPENQRLTICVPSSKIAKAYMLADAGQNRLKIEQSEGKSTISLPSEVRDPIATVVVLEVGNASRNTF